MKEDHKEHMIYDTFILNRVWESLWKAKRT